MQVSERHLELLHALGMESSLTPSMILLCAQWLDQAFGAASMSGVQLTSETTAAMQVEDAKPADVKQAVDDAKAIKEIAQSARKGAKPKTKPKTAPVKPLAQQPGEAGGGAETKASGDTGDEAAVSNPQDSGNSAALDVSKSDASADSSAPTATKALGDDLQVMSFELVEEFARAAAEIWAPVSALPTMNMGMLTDGTEMRANRMDMASLLEAASLRILLARTHHSQYAIRAWRRRGKNAAKMQQTIEIDEKMLRRSL